MSNTSTCPSRLTDTRIVMNSIGAANAKSISQNTRLCSRSDNGLVCSSQRTRKASSARGALQGTTLKRLQQHGRHGANEYQPEFRAVRVKDIGLGDVPDCADQTMNESAMRDESSVTRQIERPPSPDHQPFAGNTADKIDARFVQRSAGAVLVLSFDIDGFQDRHIRWRIVSPLSRSTREITPATCPDGGIVRSGFAKSPSGSFTRSQGWYTAAALRLIGLAFVPRSSLTNAISSVEFNGSEPSSPCGGAFIRTRRSCFSTASSIIAWKTKCLVPLAGRSS